MALIAWTEEALRAAEQAIAVVAPADALARFKGSRQLGLVREHRRQGVETAGHIDGKIGRAHV